MSVHSYAHAEARDELIRAALRVIAADHYADDAAPHADAESEYAGERLALAARALVQAADALPADQQPVGWPAPTSDADTLSRVRAALERVQRRYVNPPDEMVDKGWRYGMAEAISEMTAALKEGDA